MNPDHKIGDLLLDKTVIIPRNIEIDLTKSKPGDFENQYVFGIIVDIEKIGQLEYLSNSQQFTDRYLYSIQWADHPAPITRYSTESVWRFKDMLNEAEREIDNESNSKK